MCVYSDKMLVGDGLAGGHALASAYRASFIAKQPSNASQHATITGDGRTPHLMNWYLAVQSWWILLANEYLVPKGRLGLHSILFGSDSLQLRTLPSWMFIVSIYLVDWAC